MHQRKWPENIAICIPSYKAEQTLRSFLPLLLTVVPPKYITVIDDASGDHTAELCKSHSIYCLKHIKNKGKGATLATGFKHVLGLKKVQWIITMDADGQHDPQDLQALIDYVTNNPDTGICIGKREMKIGKMPLSRICSNRITSAILSFICGTPILDSQCGYRIYASKLLSHITIEFKRFEMESEAIQKAAFLGYHIGFTPVRTVYLDGASHISHIYDTFRWIRAVMHVNRTLHH